MKKWMIFFLAFLCVVVMLWAGIDAVANHQSRWGMFFTFVGSMTIIGLAIDVVNHVRARRPM